MLSVLGLSKGLQKSGLKENIWKAHPNFRYEDHTYLTLVSIEKYILKQAYSTTARKTTGTSLQESMLTDVKAPK